MLMMLASWGQVVQIAPADAHDAGFLGPSVMMLIFWGQVDQIGLADARNGGFLAPSGPNRPG